MEYNIYCDETCHLEHDDSNVMALGAIWTPLNLVRSINDDIRNIKLRHRFHLHSEAKWTKVCRKHLALYDDLVDYFFNQPDLHFRCVLIPHKDKLRHEAYGQSHDDWYYKMYFNLLKALLSPQDIYNVYIDIKDTHSYEKSQKLNDVCCNNMYDFSHQILQKIQPIRSDEVEIMQIVDILTGAMAYNSRIFYSGHRKSLAKECIIMQIKKRSGYQLTKSTLYREDKFNIFVWQHDYKTGALYAD